MTQQEKLRQNYQCLADWYQFRQQETTTSQQELTTLLARIHRDVPADEQYDKDIDDLESLRLIYESSLRRFESQVDRYNKLLDSLD